MTEIPAPAGCKVLFFQGDMVYDEEPVISFVNKNGAILPVIATGVLDPEEADSQFAILFADGHVEDDEHGTFDSLESFEQYLDEVGLPGIVAVDPVPPRRK
jgi:prepilin-type processing-associated H-X9-DG protein